VRVVVDVVSLMAVLCRHNTDTVFYIHGSVHHESNLITVQQDATYSVYYISVGTLHVSGVDIHHQELVQL